MYTNLPFWWQRSCFQKTLGSKEKEKKEFEARRKQIERYKANVQQRIRSYANTK